MRRTAKTETFSVARCAVVLGMSEKDINNSIDHDLTPLGISAIVEGARELNRSALLVVAFMRARADALTSRLRKALAPRVYATGWSVDQVGECGVMVCMLEHRTAVEAGLARLRAAETNVERHPKVMGGEPCLKDTRIPVYMIATLATGVGVEETCDTYPTLSPADVETALVYAKAHPRKGRPKTTKLPGRPISSVTVRVKLVKA